MFITQQLSDATRALVAPLAFRGVDRSRVGLVQDVQGRARELLAMQAGQDLSEAQVAYLQALRSRLQDFCLQSFTVAQDWLDAFGNAYRAAQEPTEAPDDLSTAPVPAVAYVVQDGEMFYIHTDADGEDYVAFRQAPIPVEYFNTEDAAKARAWLVAEYPATQFTFI